MIQELIDKIEELFEKKPKDKRKSEYKEWISQINPLIREVNKLAKLKLYNEQR